MFALFILHLPKIADWQSKSRNINFLSRQRLLNFINNVFEKVKPNFVILMRLIRF